MAKAAQNNDQALNAFIGAKVSIDQMLGELQAMSNELFNTHPYEINWADVGNVSRIERRLKELLDMLKMEGEYSK